MAILDGIEVRIASKTKGKAFDEYDKPNTVSSADGLSIQKYIQAETGLDFYIEVFIKPSFKLYRASGIQASVDIDGGKVAKSRYWSKEKFLGKLRRGEPFIFDDVLHKEGMQWRRMKFNFGSLEIDEDLDQGEEILDRQVERLGTIKISIARVNRRKRFVPKPKESMYHPDIATDVSKELIKDRNISHAMEPGEKILTKAPKPSSSECCPYPGKNGRRFTLVFRYRSQMDLELLGCSPHYAESESSMPETQRASRELTAQTTEQPVEQRSYAREDKEPANANMGGDPTAAEDCGGSQQKGGAGIRKLLPSSWEASNTKGKSDESIDVEESEESIRLDGFTERRELDTDAQFPEDRSNHILQENQLLHAENSALKQTIEKMTALLHDLTGNKTNVSTPSNVGTPKPVISPAGLSYSQIPRIPNIKRERVKEEDHTDGSGRSASIRNRPSKRSKTIDLTDD